MTETGKREERGSLLFGFVTPEGRARTTTRALTPEEVAEDQPFIAKVNALFNRLPAHPPKLQQRTDR